MKSYNEILKEQDYWEYLQAVDLVESYYNKSLDEGVLDSLKGMVKKKVDFIKMVAEKSRYSASKIVALFKDKRVYKFFSSIKFSFDRLYAMLKRGYKGYQHLQKIISEYVAETKVVKWTHRELKKFGEWLNKHPNVKRLTGPVVSAILLYIWLNMAFSGDFVADMDFTDIINALQGNFDLADLFAGPEGIKMMMLFVTGIFGHSFPWPGSTSQQLIGGVILSLGRMFKKGEFKRIR